MISWHRVLFITLKWSCVMFSNELFSVVSFGSHLIYANNRSLISQSLRSILMRTRLRVLVVMAAYIHLVKSIFNSSPADTHTQQTNENGSCTDNWIVSAVISGVWELCAFKHGNDDGIYQRRSRSQMGG